MYKRLLFAIALLLTSTAPVAEVSILTTASDPANTCSILEKNLPDNLFSIRKLAQLRGEEVVDDKDYCENQAQDCRIHTMDFQGLTLSLLARRKTHKAAPLSATLSTSSWRLLGGIKVGQRLVFLEKYYGVKIPRDTSPVVLMGECTPLTVWHAKERVTQLELDCQACI